MCRRAASLQVCRALRFVNGDTQKAADFIMVQRQKDQVWVIASEAGSYHCLTALVKAPVSCETILLPHCAAGHDSTCAQGKNTLT